jgi:hypothetical protein
MTEKTITRKKTGPKPRYGEAKTMVSFRLSPEALSIIKTIAVENGLSQAEVLERWARDYKNNLNVAPSAAAQSIASNRDLVASER